MSILAKLRTNGGVSVCTQLAEYVEVVEYRCRTYVFHGCSFVSEGDKRRCFVFDEVAVANVKDADIDLTIPFDGMGIMSSAEILQSVAGAR